MPPRDGPRFIGSVISYENSKGFGFIECPSVPEGDIYFNRSHLPPQLQGQHRLDIRGALVEFSVFLTPDGKPRAESIRLVDERRDHGRGRHHEGRGGRDRGERDHAPAPELDEATIEKMTRFLEEKGGSMDFGKFTSDFRGVKKSQLEPHFTLTPEEDVGGGRWQISLMSAEEAAARPKPTPTADGDGGREDIQILEDLGRQSGTISLFDVNKGYGFIKSPEVPQGDIYFRRTELPPEVPASRAIKGATVEFDCKVTSNGKPRAFALAVLELPAGGEEGSERRRSDEPAPELPEEKLTEMREYLAEQGGSMDYGKFSNAFAGVKKGSLEGHFEFVAESGNAGGRWTILLPGAEPPAPRPAREGPPRERGGRGMDRGMDRGDRGRMPPPGRGRGAPVLEPSPGLWLIGCIRRWDERKQYGFVCADGADDIFVHANDLPVELQQWGDKHGIEVCVELDVAPDGKLKVANLRALLGPDGRGGWVFRRA